MSRRKTAIFLIPMQKRDAKFLKIGHLSFSKFYRLKQKQEFFIFSGLVRLFISINN